MLITTLLLVSSGLTAPAPRQAAAEPAPPQSCLAVLVTGPRNEPVRGLRFSASRVSDLRFTTLFSPRLRGTHRLELKVYTPRGFLYQRLAAPFDGTPPPTVRTGASRRPQRSVALNLPVAGTAITTNSLYGLWKVVPTLDGTAVPCGRAQSFTIEQ